MFDIKRMTAFLTAVMSAVCLTSCTKKNLNASEVSYGEFEVTFLDVGKADAMILRTANSTVIIDCGEKGDGKDIVNMLSEEEITSVDCLIITHFDQDHVGGAAKVIKELDVKRVLTPDYVRESDETKKYQKALDSKSITPEKLTNDISFSLDGVDYTVYAPEKTDYGVDNDNDFSLVTKAVHGENILLFTGDAMEERLSEIMDIGECTLLKVPYHGRKLDNLEEFLNAVKPKSAVVCTSKGEFSSQVQTLLSNRKIPVYSTCFNGIVKAVSNGKEIRFTAETGSV